jgi:predicted transglutaminase-like cysteine proteinase
MLRSALLLLALSCSGSPVSIDFVPAPYGFVEFCRNAPNVCAQTGPVETIRWTAFRAEQLEVVNHAVNKGTAYMTDEDHFGRTERWTYVTDGRGDCEDFALEKQRRLIAKGWPRSALLITTVYDRDGNYHAVLTVMTTSGPKILDNQTFAILSPEATGYQFDARQSRAHAGRWVHFGDNT